MVLWTVLPPTRATGNNTDGPQKVDHLLNFSLDHSSAVAHSGIALGKRRLDIT